MKRKPKSTPPPFNPNRSFETFRRFGKWEEDNVTQKDPYCFNDLSIRKYRITVELVEESVEVLAERLQSLWRKNDNFHHWHDFHDEAKRLGVVLDPKMRGVDLKKESK